MRIVAVSYLNTLPFIYGLRQFLSDADQLELAVPALCAQSLLRGNADVGLIPVGALPDDNTLQSVLNYGIACNGKVRTVGVFSHAPIENLKYIVSDAHSRTSNLLVKILCREHWKISPEFVSTASESKEETGMVLIGDKVFAAEKAYPYCYDMGEAWKEMTGLPFVFARWMSRETLPQDFLERLEKAFSWGLEQRMHAIQQYVLQQEISAADAQSYLYENIQYHIGEAENAAIDLFLQKAHAL